MGLPVATALEKREYQITEIKKNINIIPRPEARILIVDDSRVNLMVASGLMKKYNMQIDTASRGMDRREAGNSPLLLPSPAPAPAWDNRSGPLPALV